MEHPINKQLLFRYLTSRSTPLERQAVDEWLKKAGATEIFHQWLLEWEIQSPQYQPDSETAYLALLDRIDSQEGALPYPENSAPTRRRFSFLNWRIAASATVLICLGVWLLRRPILFETYKTEYGQTSSFVLNDGSRVTLNANSSLAVPRFGFNTGVREVYLKGEAEFSVRHTLTDQRFVVKTSERCQVEVLGTEFTVFARSRGTRVALHEGKIRFDYQQGAEKKKLLMKPGELVTLSPEGAMQLSQVEKPELQAAWKEQRFVFNDTSVREICILLGENFGLVIRPGNEEVAARTISGNFKAQTADDLLEVLREVLNLQIKKKGESMVLRSQETKPKLL